MFKHRCQCQVGSSILHCLSFHSVVLKCSSLHRWHHDSAFFFFLVLFLTLASPLKCQRPRYKAWEKSTAPLNNTSFSATSGYHILRQSQGIFFFLFASLLAVALLPPVCLIRPKTKSVLLSCWCFSRSAICLNLWKVFGWRCGKKDTNAVSLKGIRTQTVVIKGNCRCALFFSHHSRPFFLSFLLFYTFQMFQMIPKVCLSPINSELVPGATKESRLVMREGFLCCSN